MSVRPRWSLALLAFALIPAACSGPENEGGGTSVPPPGGTVTKLTSGGRISSASISRNGRFVAYASTSPTPGADHNAGQPDVFVLDRSTSAISRVSTGNGASESPSVGDDGSIVFRSSSTDLGAPGAGARLNAFRWTPTGGVTRITDSPADVLAPLLSADGSTVVFGAPEGLNTPGGSTRTQTFRWTASAPTVFTMVPAVGTGGSTPVAIGPAGDRVVLAEPGRLSMFDGASTSLIASAPPSPAAPHTATFAVAPHAIADDGDVVYAEVTYSYDPSAGVLAFENGTAHRWDRQTAAVSTLGASGLPAGPVQSADGRHVLYSDLTAVGVDQDTSPGFLPGAIRSLDTTSGSNVTVVAAPQATFGTVSGDGRYAALVSTDPALASPDSTTDPVLYLWDRGS